MNEKIISAIEAHDVIRTMPAMTPEGATPMGNGTFGGMLWLNEGDFVVQLNHTEFWKAGDLLPPGDPEFGGYPVSLGRVILSRETGFWSEGDTYHQRLSLTEAVTKVKIEREGGNSHLSLFYDMDRDAMVLRWKETGPGRIKASVSLEAWRDSVSFEQKKEGVLLKEAPAAARTREEEKYLRKLLGDSYRDKIHAHTTAIAIDGAEVDLRAEDMRVQFTVEGDNEVDLTILISTAVGEDHDGLDEKALQIIDVTRKADPGELDTRHREWWQDFWSKSYVRLESKDGSAERFEGYWYMLLYLMASSNRGHYPVKFNHGNWLSNTDDKREWGGGYWYYNERDMILAMMPANHLDLAQGLYQQYWNARAVLKRQTEHLFGHAGMFIPETSSPDGSMFLRDRTGIYSGPTKFIQLIFSTGLEIAYHMYLLSQYSGDDAFVRDRVYPFMMDVVEFFRIHMFKDEDGAYHIYPANGHETWWRVKDDICDIAGLRACLPILIRLSEEFGTDEAKRGEWKEFLENMAPLPRGHFEYEGTPEWEVRGEGIIGLCTHVVSTDHAANMYAPCIPMHDNELHNCHPVAVYGIYPFQLTHLDSPDRTTGINTYRRNVHPYFRETWAQDVIVPAILGLPEEAKKDMIDFADREWDLALPFMERYGKTNTTLAAMLIQWHDDTLYLFPALPKDWNGAFRLLAPGPFEIEAERRDGAVDRIEILSLRKRRITLANPWGSGSAGVSSETGEEFTVSGERLSWDCEKGGTYVLTANRG